MRKLTNEEKIKIKNYIKNQIDISELIKNVNLSGEDLNYAIIKNFTIVDQTLQNVNFSNAVLGEERKINNFSGNTLINCNFKGTRFLGTVFFRRNKCKNCSFDNAYMPFVEYQHTEFDDACTFCDVVFRLGSRISLGANFGDNFFRELVKFWDIKVVREKK